MQDSMLETEGRKMCETMPKKIKQYKTFLL